MSRHRKQDPATSDAASADNAIAAPAGERKLLFEATDIVVDYGRIQALRGLTIRVHEGEFVTVLGANGAGKTTTMRALTGLLPLTRGKVLFDGEDITHVKAHERVKRGIVMSPAGRGVFPEMTLQENLDMGRYASNFKSKAEYSAQLDAVFELFPQLAERRTHLGRTLSGAEQQMVAIGRSLMARPRLLMLDEPSMGLAPTILQQVFDVIGEIHASGTAVLLVEQNAQQALMRAERAYILDSGVLTAEGSGAELAADPAVKAANLGVG